MSDVVERTHEKPVPCPDCGTETPHAMRDGVDGGWVEYTEGECQRCGYTSAVCTGIREHMAPPEAASMRAQRHRAGATLNEPQL